MKLVLAPVMSIAVVALAACGTPYSGEPITAYGTGRDWKGATDCLDDALLLQPVHVVTERDAAQRTANIYLYNPDNRHVGVIVVTPAGRRGASMAAQALEEYEPVAAKVAGACQRT